MAESTSTSNNNGSNQQRKVDHKYVDYVSVMEENMAGVVKAAHTSDRNFPVKLHFMLNEVTNDGLSHIVSWQPHGRCFLVHKQDDFINLILPM